MKILNKILIASIGSLLLFSSCEYEDKFDKIEQRNNKAEFEALKADYTISQLKTKFMTTEFLMNDNKESAKYKEMFKTYKIPQTEKALIKGVVLSSDIEGNTYKKIVVRDDADGSAIDISVDASGLRSLWPQGVRVAINTAGLHIGDYANFPSIGLETYNTSKNRYEIGRLPSNIAKDRIIAYDMPDKSLLNPVEVTIPQILADAASDKKFYSTLVTIKNVRFGYYTESADDGTLSNFQSEFIHMVDETEREVEFSLENDINVPVSRVLKDKNGNTISLTTSFYAKFAADYLPQGEYDITVIVAWYRDQAKNTGNMQLLLQSISDIKKSSSTPSN